MHLMSKQNSKKKIKYTNSEARGERGKGDLRANEQGKLKFWQLSLTGDRDQWFSSSAMD